ncbi:protein of unknown function [Legionella fallonii LLAP-10]|uniref:Uncharacterized protein n=1 Tax=Legionella fallonii LLAP-10 TaxID=1212491 RepID=A0A098G454_9GAMM|nr:protein of unknown function [Legionella fallonii LLAP-10]
MRQTVNYLLEEPTTIYIPEEQNTVNQQAQPVFHHKKLWVVRCPNILQHWDNESQKKNNKKMTNKVRLIFSQYHPFKRMEIVKTWCFTKKRH